jgi:hypothetical protein
LLPAPEAIASVANAASAEHAWYTRNFFMLVPPWNRASAIEALHAL